MLQHMMSFCVYSANTYRTYEINALQLTSAQYYMSVSTACDTGALSLSLFCLILTNPLWGKCGTIQIV